MTVTGMVRVDLSRFVHGGCLLLGGAETRAVHECAAFADPTLVVQIDIGSAGSATALDWAIDTLAEVFAGRSVLVVGADPRGVAQAARVFTAICTKAAA